MIVAIQGAPLSVLKHALLEAIQGHSAKKDRTIVLIPLLTGAPTIHKNWLQTSDFQIGLHCTAQKAAQLSVVSDIEPMLEGLARIPSRTCVPFTVCAFSHDFYARHSQALSHSASAHALFQKLITVRKHS